MIRALAFVMILVVPGVNSIAANPPPVPTAEASLSRGLKFLLQQRNQDGSFGVDSARLLATSRAVLVFLQAGNVPDSGRYGTAVKDAEEWMIRSTLPGGGFAGSDGRTRAQAAAVLALAELYGVEANPPRRALLLAALRLAVGPLLESQVPQQTPPRLDTGGWGDEKNAPAATLPLTTIAAVALSCARDVGIAVPAPVLERARRYILACNDLASGGFATQPGKPPSVDATAAALVTLDVLSVPGDDNTPLAAAAAYLEAQPATAGQTIGFIGAAWICWCDTRMELAPAEKIRGAYIDRLIKSQDADGAWSIIAAKPDAQPSNRLAATELALIGMTAHMRSTPVLRH